MNKGLIALGATLLALAFAAPAFANDVIVDNDFAQCPDADTNSIQVGVEMAGPGDKVKVCDGVYFESVTIEADDAGVHVEGAGVEKVILDGGNTDPHGFLLRGTTGVTIEKFTVQHYHDNIVLDGANHNLLKNNVSTATFEHDAFQLFESHWNVIEDNEASMTAAPLGCGINLINSSNNLVKSNLVFGNPNAGIFLLTSGPGNVVTDNEVTANPRVEVSPGPPPVLSNGDGIRNLDTPGTVMRYNTVTQNGRHGIFVLGVVSTGVRVLDNVVRENRAAATSDGIRLEGASNNTVDGNQSIRNGHDGVHLINAHNNEVLDNDLLFNGTGGNGCGIDVESGSTGNQILRNDLIGHTRAGVRLRAIGALAPTANTVADNDADKNPGYGILLEGANGNLVLRNEADDNGFDGIRADVNSTGNVFERNAMASNIFHDCHDDSAGPFPPAGTANLWTENEGKTQNRPGLCKDATVTAPPSHP